MVGEILCLDAITTVCNIFPNGLFDFILYLMGGQALLVYKVLKSTPFIICSLSLILVTSSKWSNVRRIVLGRLLSASVVIDGRLLDFCVHPKRGTPGQAGAPFPPKSTPDPWSAKREREGRGLLRLIKHAAIKQEEIPFRFRCLLAACATFSHAYIFFSLWILFSLLNELAADWLTQRFSNWGPLVVQVVFRKLNWWLLIPFKLFHYFCPSYTFPWGKKIQLYSQLSRKIWICYHIISPPHNFFSALMGTHSTCVLIMNYD